MYSVIAQNVTSALNELKIPDCNASSKIAIGKCQSSLMKQNTMICIVKYLRVVFKQKKNILMEQNIFLQGLL